MLTLSSKWRNLIFVNLRPQGTLPKFASKFQEGLKHAGEIWGRWCVGGEECVCSGCHPTMWTSVELSSCSWQLRSYYMQVLPYDTLFPSKKSSSEACVFLWHTGLWVHSSDCCSVANMELMDSELGFHGISICLDTTGRARATLLTSAVPRRGHTVPHCHIPLHSSWWAWTQGPGTIYEKASIIETHITIPHPILLLQPGELLS